MERGGREEEKKKTIQNQNPACSIILLGADYWGAGALEYFEKESIRESFAEHRVGLAHKPPSERQSGSGRCAGEAESTHIEWAVARASARLARPTSTP